ncbi:hypothetical protein B0H19DRAFT_1200495 [Mycena capillaripes]|nr:hypothetical protein B0H19DRAFT_1200495 [Mycena capillaripes]
MQTTPIITTTFTAVHCAEAVVPAATARTSTEAQPVNLSTNGPQCASCGWRGGGHAKNCPWR